MRNRKSSHTLRNKIDLQVGDEYAHLSVRYGHNDAYRAHVFLHKDWGPRKLALALRHFAGLIDNISIRKKRR